MPNPAVFRELDGVQYKLCPHCDAWKQAEGSFVRYSKPLASGAPKYGSWCKKCIAAKQASYHKRTWGPEKLQFTAHKRTQSARAYLAYLRSKAVRRGGDCLSLDALETLWFAQGGKCALTGWPMTMELAKGVVPTNCSIDRVDSLQGYIPGNVQLVCRAVNVAKHDLSPNDFLALCRAVVEKTHG
jgi:hypothetical protein